MMKSKFSVYKSVGSDYWMLLVFAKLYLYILTQLTKGLYCRSGWRKLGILPSSEKPYLSNLTEQWQNYTTLINFSFFINCKLFAITWETISLCFFIEGIMIIAGQLKGLFDYNTKEYSGYSIFGQLVNWMVHLGTEYKASN